MNIMKKFLLRAVIVTSLMINFSVSSRLGIVGGEETDVEHFPFMAGYLTDGILKCGGSIISDKCVLTAGKHYKHFNYEIASHFAFNFKLIVLRNTQSTLAFESDPHLKIAGEELSLLQRSLNTNASTR